MSTSHHTDDTTEQERRIEQRLREWEQSRDHRFLGVARWLRRVQAEQRRQQQAAKRRTP